MQEKRSTSTWLFDVNDPTMLALWFLCNGCLAGMVDQAEGAD